MSIELNHAGAWLKKLGSSQASDLTHVVPTAISPCVKPSCKDRSEHPSAASKSVEREDLQGLFVTTLEATTLLLLQAHLRGARSYTTKCISSPHATRILILIMLKGIFFHFLLLVVNSNNDSDTTNNNTQYSTSNDYISCTKTSKKSKCRTEHTRVPDNFT